MGTGRSYNAPPPDGYPGGGRWGILVTHVKISAKS